jgi:triosephosphate isomerase
MRRAMVAGNWKMMGTRAELEALAKGIAAGSGEVGRVELTVFPAFIYIDQVQRVLAESTVAWGSQNIASEGQGAFTGEVSAAMVAQFGCQYVIIGHSERRQYYGEDDSIVAAKYLRAIEAGLKPIICVGETLAEREAGLTLAAILALENAQETLSHAVIAYEPVWAIGTGLTATSEQAQAVHQHLREQVAQRDEKLAKALRILYGGSVKRDNAAELMAQPDIDGALVGGASLDYKHFLDIARLCNRSF